MDHEQIVRVIDDSGAGHKYDSIPYRQNPFCPPPANDFFDQQRWIVDVDDRMWHDPTEQTHPSQGGHIIADPQRGNAVPLFGFNPGCPSGATGHHYQLGSD